MIHVYFWPTPNGHKVTLLLEELGMPYEVHGVNIGAGEQFEPAFLAISPNNRMPAIVDDAPADGGAPISVFESGAILQYLAAKGGAFWPADPRAQAKVNEWLFWQVGGFGPMLGQVHHFARYAPEPIPYAIERYTREAQRLYGVLDRRLAEAPWLGGEAYSIADMAAYPWAAIHAHHLIDLDQYPNARRWHDAIRDRPATQRAYAMAEARFPKPAPLTDEQKKVLFQTPAR